MLDRAISREEAELAGGEKGEYEAQRKTVKERLTLLLSSTGELLKAADGTAALTPDTVGIEVGATVRLLMLMES